MRPVGLALLGLLLAQSTNAWQTLAPLPEPRQEVAVAEVNGLIYVAGGFGVDGATSERLEAYDPAAHRWKRLPPLPVPVNHAAAVGLGGKLYVLGGYQSPQGLAGPSKAVQIYDPARQTWSQGSPLPTARGGLAVTVLDGKMYAIGGAGGPSLGDFAVLDPALGQWTELPPMPTPRDHTGAAVVDGKIYVMGGRNQRSFTLNTLEVYDPKTAKWRALEPMPTGRSGHAVAGVGGCVYVFGGEGNRQSGAGTFAQLEVYSVASGQWSRLPDMPTPRHGMAAAVLDGKIYLPAGATRQGMGAATTNEVFTPPACPG
jgi:N-acetylneuraminic acid mutarotase